MKTHYETCSDGTDLIPLCGRKIKQHLVTTTVPSQVTCAACLKLLDRDEKVQD